MEVYSFCSEKIILMKWRHPESHQHVSVHIKLTAPSLKNSVWPFEQTFKCSTQTQCPHFVKVSSTSPGPHKDSCTRTLTHLHTHRLVYEGGVSGGSPSSLGVAVSSLGSRLSFRLTVLSEGGGVDSERGGVNSETGGANSVGGGLSGEGSWVPLAVGGGTGPCVGVALSIEGGVNTGSALCGAELERRLSVRESEAFSTKRHCMMLVSFPPVEIRWLSLYRKLTLVTWLLWALYLWLGACNTHTDYWSIGPQLVYIWSWQLKQDQ